MSRHTAGGPGPGAVRSLWLEEALAREGGLEVTPIAGHVKADVCVVGGGFTGLWTALELKARQPDLDVVVVEADICGAGASGRNGGFAMSLWSKFSSLRKLCGLEEAVRLATASADAVNEIGSFCLQHGIEAEYVKAGWLWTATSATQMDAWRKTLDSIADSGLSPYLELSPAEVASRSGSVTHIGGVFEPSAARIQPAALARGMRRVALEKGVRIYERSRMVALDIAGPPRVVCQSGSVAADAVVLALNAWSAQFPEIRRKLVVVSSDVGATAPIPDRLRELTWEDGLCVSDSRRLVNYYRTTSDGRVVFGKGGGTLTFGGRIGESFDHASPRVSQIAAHLHRAYPSLADVPIASSWRGPIDYSLSGVPFFVRPFGRDEVVLGAGFSGNGVGPSLLGGRILASMALGIRDEWSTGGLTSMPETSLPFEPLRFVGGQMVRAAIARKEGIEDRGARPGLLTRAVAGLDPTGFVDVGKASGSKPARAGHP